MAGKAPLWCVGLALAAAIWRLLVAIGSIGMPVPRRGARFLFGAVTAALVIAVALAFARSTGSKLEPRCCW
jgi:hypothetical protein